MSSLWTGLLFLHGHAHDPQLARRLANTPSTPPQGMPGGKRQRKHSPLVALVRMIVSRVDASQRRGHRLRHTDAIDCRGKNSSGIAGAFAGRVQALRVDALQIPGVTADADG